MVNIIPRWCCCLLGSTKEVDKLVEMSTIYNYEHCLVVPQVLECLVLQVQLLATSVLYSNIRRKMELLLSFPFYTICLLRYRDSHDRGNSKSLSAALLEPVQSP
jgi:hypothetical protein